MDYDRQFLELQDRLAKAEARLATSDGDKQGDKPQESSVAGSDATTIAVSPEIPTPQSILPRWTSQPQLQAAPSAIYPTFPNTTQGQWVVNSLPTAVDSTMEAPSMEDYDMTATLSAATTEPWMFGTGPMIGLLDSIHASPPSPTTDPGQLLSLQDTHEHFRISTADLAILHSNYFDTMYHSLPWVDKTRFNAEYAATPKSPPLLALSYALALTGCTLSAKYHYLQDSCYNLARTYSELCERDPDENHLISLNLFQALLFINRYESRHKRPLRAWMTIGRLNRLSKILGLDQMDRNITPSDPTTDLRAHLPATSSHTLLEERRRCFWALYMTIEVRLPCLGVLGSAFQPSQTPLLRDACKDPAACGPQLSSYAACVLVVEFINQCLEDAKPSYASPSSTAFWDRHYALVKTLMDRTAILQSHLNAASVKEDPITFSSHMNLCAIDIYLNEEAMSQIKRQGLPTDMALDHQRRSKAAAFKISSALRLNWPSKKTDNPLFFIQSNFLNWPIVMAMKPLCRELVSLKLTDAASNGVGHSLRLLLDALDHSEEAGGYWHTVTAGIATTLHEWEQNSGFDAVGL